jgi:hypothetical protein
MLSLPYGSLGLPPESVRWGREGLEGSGSRGIYHLPDDQAEGRKTALREGGSSHQRATRRARVLPLLHPHLRCPVRAQGEAAQGIPLPYLTDLVGGEDRLPIQRPVRCPGKALACVIVLVVVGIGIPAHDRKSRRTQVTDARPVLEAHGQP